MRSWERRLALVCAVAGVLLLFTGASILLVEGRLARGASYTLLAGLALLIGYGVLDPRAAIDLVRSRQARFGSLSVIISAAVIGILITLNVLASRSAQTLDLTRARLYTLSPKSVAVLRKLDADLEVTGFFRAQEQESRQQAQTLLALYQQKSQRVKVRFVDPDAEALRAQQLGVRISGSLAFQYRARPPVVLNLGTQSEADITGAILRLESERTPAVCWAAGEGERGLKDGNEIHGYSAAADRIKSANYQTRDAVLAQQAVPADCDILAIVGPSTALSEAAVGAVGSYLEGGGKLLLALDPWNFKALDSVNSVLKPFGAAFAGGLVVEGDAAHSARNDPTTPVAFEYGDSPIAKDLARKFVFLPQTTHITGDGKDSAPRDVITSSASAYEIAQPRDSFGRQARDRGGPLKLMQTLERKQAGGRRARIVLAGTSAIAENRTLPPNAGGANGDLLLASLDWLSEQEDLIGPAPKPAAAAPLALSDEQLRFNYFVALILLPGLILFAGALVLVRRRTAAPA